MPLIHIPLEVLENNDNKELVKEDKSSLKGWHKVLIGVSAFLVVCFSFCMLWYFIK